MYNGISTYLKGCPLGLVVLLATAPSWAQDAVPVTKDYLIDEYGERRAFSRAVATTGGTTVWVAGHTTLTDADGNDISGDFEAQTRELFRLIEQRLAHYGGTLSDIVTMTVYIQDVRDGDRFVELRSEYFNEGRYPSSALITVVGFARPGTMIEIKPTAVIGQEVP